MIEIPESAGFSKQLNISVTGKRIKNVIVGQTPHKFAWFNGTPADYASLLTDRRIGPAQSYGGYVALSVEEDVTILLAEGERILLHREADHRPQKHQLLIEFYDGSALSVSVLGYGLIYCGKENKIDNKYYTISRQKPSPLTGYFDEAYFAQLVSDRTASKLSAKAFLATEQRIPGLGNGVLQDILFNAGIHPKTKISSLSDIAFEKMYASIKNTLSEMAAKGGRDVEIDLYGNSGGYTTKMSKKTVDKPCPVCGSTIEKAAYLGGSVYYCPSCQALS